MKSGLTHVKYEHYHYPRIVELICPNCNKKCLAENKFVPLNENHFIDIAPYPKEWSFNCSLCLNRKKLYWTELRNFKLWNSIEVKNELIWAWNQDHLDLIIKKLRKQDTNGHPWNWFSNYLNKSWLKNIKKDSDIKKIEKHCTQQ